MIVDSGTGWLEVPSNIRLTTREENERLEQRMMLAEHWLRKYIERQDKEERK